MNILIAGKNPRTTHTILERSKAYFGSGHEYTLSSDLYDAKLKLHRTNSNILVSELGGSVSATAELPKQKTYLTAISIDRIQEEYMERTPLGGHHIIYVKKPFTKAEVVQALSTLFEPTEQTAAKPPVRFMVPVSDGYRFLHISDIVHVEASGSYSIFHLHDGTRLTLSKRIGHYQKELGPVGFVRVHSSHIINLQYTQKYVRHGGLHVILENGTSVPISRSQKAEFEQSLTQMIKL
jgi:hypothetical protein